MSVDGELNKSLAGIRWLERKKQKSEQALGFQYLQRFYGKAEVSLALRGRGNRGEM